MAAHPTMHDRNPINAVTTAGFQKGFARSFSRNVAINTIEAVESVVKCFK